ncbi:DUF3817 domain-containing protein [Sphingomonadaceae bacterium jetA1]|jgi:integral membrane protein|uniref:DUF3817 domain-containing protein n=1 Tax=Facivitalis istanbulensis TaxID=3075838 RepID=UPI00348BAC4E
MNVHAPDVAAFRRLRLMALIEGTTLVCLILVAVPLKHLLHMPVAVSVMGPIHGVAFVAYVWALMAAASSDAWTSRETIRFVIGALVPFGSFVNERWLKRRERAMADGVAR